jgi:hypothetical protein
MEQTLILFYRRSVAKPADLGGKMKLPKGTSSKGPRKIYQKPLPFVLESPYNAAKSMVGNKPHLWLDLPPGTILFAIS